MASNDNFGMTPQTAAALLVLLGVGAAVVLIVFWALVGAAIGVGFALWNDEVSNIISGAKAGALFGLVYALWRGGLGFVKGRLGRS